MSQHYGVATTPALNNPSVLVGTRAWHRSTDCTGFVGGATGGKRGALLPTYSVTGTVRRAGDLTMAPAAFRPEGVDRASHVHEVVVVTRGRPRDPRQLESYPGIQGLRAVGVGLSPSYSRACELALGHWRAELLWLWYCLGSSVWSWGWLGPTEGWGVGTACSLVQVGAFCESGVKTACRVS